MGAWWRSASGLNWRAAALLGLLSSTFSTVVSQLTAARIGRDAVTDWMSVAAIPLRNGVLAVEPSWSTIAAGIAFHQWADFSWAVIFFGLLGRWTAGLRPWTILPIAAGWAVFTSFAEWAFLVPVLPFSQPIFALEQPYWIGLLVHGTSATMYPLFPWIRDRLAGLRPSAHRRFAAAWAGLALAGMSAIGGLALLGVTGHELGWTGTDEASDQSYMRRMMAHHAQGIEVARIGADRVTDGHLREISRLIAAEQLGENEIFAQWWRSWFPLGSDVCTPGEQAAMPGMLSPDELQALRTTDASAFDGLFIRLMSRHHRGAIAMADEEMRGSGDIRLRVMAQGIRHGQRGEIQLMRNLTGLAAVRSALAALTAPYGTHPSDIEDASTPPPRLGAATTEPML